MYNTTAKAKYTVTVNHTATMHNYPTTRKLFRKRKIHAREILSIAFLYVIPCLILAWLILSWVNTVNNNLTTFEYAWWNAFNLFKLIRK